MTKLTNIKLAQILRYFHFIQITLDRSVYPSESQVKASFVNVRSRAMSHLASSFILKSSILIFRSSSRCNCGTNFQLNARRSRKFWNANLRDPSIPLSLNRLLLECLQFLLWRWGLWSRNCFKNKSLTSFNVSTNSRRIFPLPRSSVDTF